MQGGLSSFKRGYRLQGQKMCFAWPSRKIAVQLIASEKMGNVVDHDSWVIYQVTPTQAKCGAAFEVITALFKSRALTGVKNG